MLKESMVFLRDQLETYIQQKTGSDAQKVAFIDGGDAGEQEFPLNFVTQLLVNVQEDRTNRTMPSGSFPQQKPEIDLNLFVLFVCRYSDYATALQSLSLVISCFQATPVFNHANISGLPPQISKLSVELSTMPFSEQNEVWNSLRRPYWPSALYKVRMLIFNDVSGLTPASRVDTVATDVSPVSPPSPN